jgi:hypothetical protein
MATPNPSAPSLSKSRLLTWLQCPKALWLGEHAPALAAEFDPGRAAIVEVGQAVGRAAWALFPGGVLVPEPATRHAEAVARTQLLLADPGVPAIFEAAFEHQGVRVRVDVLERLGESGFGLREVKASTGLKEHHLPDVAVQRWVLEGAGLRVPSVELVHIDGNFVRGAGPIDWRRFFARQDLTREAAEYARALPRCVGDMRAVLGAEFAPDVEPSRHCFDPWECGFWEHCTAAKPPAWHLGLRRASAERREIWLSALASGQPWVGPGLADALAPAAPPAWYLDFETVTPAIPLYAGTRPYQPIPFLWSLHRLGADGGVEHADYLADASAEPGADPRPALAHALLAALAGDAAPILVWSPYESRILRELANAFPALAPSLDALRARLVDLHATVRGHLYHPGFEGSYSLKEVAPALVPGFGYGDFTQVSDGAAAAAAFARLADGALDPTAAHALRAELRAYCRRDGEALLEVHRVLRELAVA